jgi:hypothetical protein
LIPERPTARIFPSLETAIAVGITFFPNLNFLKKKDAKVSDSKQQNEREPSYLDTLPFSKFHS